MTVPNRPNEIARETLRLLVTRKITPTPDNYRKLYCEIAGHGGDDPGLTAEKMLQRRSVTTALYEITQGRPLRLTEWTLEIQIEINPALLSQHMGQQVFRIKPRTFHPVLFQICCGGI